MKNILKIIFSLLLFAFLTANNAFSLEIKYPQKANYKTGAVETYILGNVDKHSSLTINGKAVKVWSGGIFCYTSVLLEGENKFVITEKNGKNVQSKTYIVTKFTPVSMYANKNYKPNVQKKLKENLFASVITDGAPVRERPTENSNRMTHLPEKTLLALTCDYGNWYKIDTGDISEPLWIHKKNVKIMSAVNSRIKTDISKVVFSDDKDFGYIKFYMDMPVVYKLKETNNDICLKIFGVKDVSAVKNALKNDVSIKSFQNNNLELLIPSKKQLWGYDANYEDGALVFKKRKAPDFDEKTPLKGVTIAIDPGHGGKEKGTLGPANIPEKDVNLAISLKLQKELEKMGANVVMTRTTDEEVEIYKRPEIAQKANAVISVSIHANSMVDGNPYERHGTEVYYYNKHAKKLAETIKNQMVEDLKLKDGGTRFASFVLTRPTMPVSVLVETAYMPNPEEYLKLINPHFQQKAAHSVAEGIKKYFLLTKDE